MLSALGIILRISPYSSECWSTISFFDHLDPKPFTWGLPKEMFDNARAAVRYLHYLPTWIPRSSGAWMGASRLLAPCAVFSGSPQFLVIIMFIFFIHLSRCTAGAVPIRPKRFRGVVPADADAATRPNHYAARGAARGRSTLSNSICVIPFSRPDRCLASPSRLPRVTLASPSRN